MIAAAGIDGTDARRRTRREAALLLLLGCVFLSGCVGPPAVRASRIRYNEVYRKTNDEQLLLNIVAARYADSPVFIDLPNITSQFELAVGGGYNSPIDGGVDLGIPGFGVGQLFYRDTPTLSFAPREGQDIGRTLVTPLTAELLRNVSPGANTRTFLLTAVNDINDISNASLATSLIPARPDNNIRFRRVVDLIVGMQERGAMELSIADFDSERYDPIPLDQVTGNDALTAVQAGYVFRTGSGDAVLTRREKKLVLRIRPEAIYSPEAIELERLLGLREGQSLYRIRTEQLESEPEAEELPAALGDETISMNMRSILQMMTFLSKGVCVPEEHVLKGICPMTRLPDGRLYDWRQITAGLFQVRSQKHRPKDAEVAVEYRGYWFYIASDDVVSRATLVMFEILFALEESERDRLGPVLTLPVN